MCTKFEKTYTNCKNLYSYLFCAALTRPEVELADGQQKSKNKIKQNNKKNVKRCINSKLIQSI